MKKLIYLVSLILLCCSCSRDYRCELKYQVAYPDTTWTNTYVFDGNGDAYFTNRRGEYDDKQRLTVYPMGISTPSSTICVVPNKNCEIKVLDFKMYRYGVDIEKKK